MIRRVALACLLVCASACTAEESPAKPGPGKAAEPAAATAQSPTAQSPTTGQAPAAKPGDEKVFGAAPSEATPFVELSAILADPKAFDGKRVRTRGEVVAVCQAAGCWCDLRPEGSKEAKAPTHVTMHGHAFFLPKDAKTKVAEIEGALDVRSLSQAEVDHYNGEGASLVAGAPIVHVDATGVVLR